MTWRDKYAYRVGDLPHATELTSYTDPDYNQGNWPYPTQHITYLAGAGMADDIRKRVGSDSDTPVIIEEEVISGGYSEYTQENDYPFEIRVGNFQKAFDSLRYFFEWLDEKER